MVLESQLTGVYLQKVISGPSHLGVENLTRPYFLIYHTAALTDNFWLIGHSTHINFLTLFPPHIAVSFSVIRSPLSFNFFIQTKQELKILKKTLLLSLLSFIFTADH